MALWRFYFYDSRGADACGSFFSLRVRIVCLTKSQAIHYKKKATNEEAYIAVASAPFYALAVLWDGINPVFFSPPFLTVSP